MKQAISATEAKALITQKLSNHFGVSVKDASVEHIYKAVALIVKEILQQGRRDFVERSNSQDGKRVYYLCMEFLMGRSLKNNLYNMKLIKPFEAAVKSFGVTLDSLYGCEPDAGLGNGGLGRLAACFLDGFASEGYLATGYSLRYEFGIFTQTLVDGWQTELPDNWLPGGDVWLVPREDSAIEIKFDGYMDESWDGSFHHVKHCDANTVLAVPCDMMVSGHGGKGVSKLRLWAAKAPSVDFDFHKFNQGELLRSVERSAMAEMITKVLYPADNHREGKSLRLSQQYFLVSASIQDIVRQHLHRFGTMDNFAQKAAIQLNDTHPALAIPELMRILLDECGYGWEQAWDIVTNTFSYTNHTVMAEALECWPEDLFKSKLPRIYQIVCEINHRFCYENDAATGGNQAMVKSMSIITDDVVRMANLCIAGSHKVNGVSAMHSEIIKDSVFSNFYKVTPDKFTNVTNGIAHRRWLCQANPKLAEKLTELIGNGFITDASKLEKLMEFKNDKTVLNDLEKIKRSNKDALCKYIMEHNGISVDPDSIFDVQVKRLHEYKRQHLSAMHILSRYLYLKENPNASITPHTYIFGAKAAPGYFLAKQIIRFIVSLSAEIEKDPVINKMIKVVFLENYNVTLAELLMPAADFSEQISLAGTEASGTGNMKLMMNGAVTLGTLDGANVEIYQEVGNENIILFGMNAQEVENLKKTEYNPNEYYNGNPIIRQAIDVMKSGLNGNSFADIAGALTTLDQYRVFADFESYAGAQKTACDIYSQRDKFNRMSLVNIAKSGCFASDRSIRDYASGIWSAKKIK